MKREENDRTVREAREAELWQKCSDGDDNAREELILSYRPMVYWLAKKLKVPYNTYPDMVQEGMVALINAVDAFEPLRKNHFSTFAYYKIHGRMINFLQRVEAKAPIPVDETDFADEDAVHAEANGEAVRSEWAIDLETAMKQLSAREAGVVSALVVEGRGAKEVAQEIDVDISHVYRIRRKALEKLKKWLGPHEKEATSEV